jgi:hypothetical protein
MCEGIGCDCSVLKKQVSARIGSEVTARVTLLCRTQKNTHDEDLIGIANDST